MTILTIEMSKEYRNYTSVLENELESLYEVAKKARLKGLDPAISPEPEIAKDLAELVEGLVGPPKVADSVRELNNKIPREEIAFKLAEEIIYRKFAHMDEREAAEQAIRTALAILTEGITAAPLQGVAKVSIKLNSDGTRYLAIYFAGPIRSAGGTEQALTLVVGDFVRRLLGLSRYKPTNEEIGRFIEEVRLFEREVARFQYHITDEELRNALQHLPVEVTGTQSNSIEVSSFRNLPRIETNRIRGGALRVVNDGIIGRSAKVWTIVKKLGIEGWEWLKTVREVEGKKIAGFMEDIIAGRPIFSFPSTRGGFRLRYGRARNTGLAAVGVHPATMKVLQNFIAAGTQLRIEGPGKSGIVLPVETLEPPIVRLANGSVVKVSNKNFEEIKDVIDKVLYLGDILVGFGDFLYNNKPLLPSGFTEEWWREEAFAAIRQKFGKIEESIVTLKVPKTRLKTLLHDPLNIKPTISEAILLSSTLQIPLHPLYTFFWSSISTEEFLTLRKWLLSSKVSVKDEIVYEIIGDLDKQIKKILEKIGLPHNILSNSTKIEINNDEAHALAYCLGFNTPKNDVDTSKSVFNIIREFTGIPIRVKAPTFIGARMGRPEKAKRREMRPLVHVLFPVGMAGGSQRNLVEASKKVIIEVDLVRRLCPTCQSSTLMIKCPKCDKETSLERLCSQCGRRHDGDFCPSCGGRLITYEKQLVNLKELMDKSCRKLKHTPTQVKGVRGLMNETKTAEIIDKGILRAKYDLSVFKDGTIRFDATNAPLCHFKAVEIGVSLEKLTKLGYYNDYEGNPLFNPNQICELKMQDVVIPRKSAEYFVRITNFCDELLEKVYELPPYYNVTKTEDLVGQLIVGLAPHTSVGVIGRIIGFTDLNICYAHPLWHSAKRRDCDGDEDAIILALDVLLNFSKAYLPVQIGGIMDAPLLLIPVINPLEVQRQAHNVDIAESYPLAFYEKTWERVMPQEISELIDTIEQRLNTEAQFQGYKYTIPVSNINVGNIESNYKQLKRMVDKLTSQLTLAEKIEAVDAKNVALKVLTTHFIRDIAGNLRAFTAQGFRCKTCNKKFRRLPLQGKCTECGSEITLTVYRGGIEKYLETANKLVKKYDISNYYAQRLSLFKDEINSLFEGNKPKQINLTDFMV